MRICSLLPSSTEIVFALGLGDRLVGITHECDYPPGAVGLPVVTASLVDHQESSSGAIHRHISEAIHGGSGVYALDQGLLERLDPDLILTQELCDVCAVSYEVVQRAVRMLPGDRRVLSLEPTNLDGILQTILSVGRLAGAQDAAEDVVAGLRRRIDAVSAKTRDVGRRPRVFAMEWLDPPFIGGHWVPEMIRLAGGTDGLGKEGRPSETAAWEEIVAYEPEVVILMPCGYHLEENIAELSRNPLPTAWCDLPAVRSGDVYAVDGSSHFNRPGPRAVDGLEVLAEILHPSLFPRQKPTDAWVRVENPASLAG